MRRTFLAALILAVLATDVALASVPPVVFLQDGFEGYALGTQLRSCVGPGTLPTPGWDTPPEVPWSIIDPDSSGGGGVGQLIYDVGCQCAGTNCVRQWSVTVYWSNSRAYTLGDMTALTAGNLTRLHFQWRQGTSYSPDYPEHAGVWLITSAPSCIAGWVGTAYHVYATTGFNSSGGAEYVVQSGCNDLDVEYDPATGSVRWYANGTLVRKTTITAGLAAQKVYARDKYVGEADELFLDDVVVGTYRANLTAPAGGAFLTTTAPLITWTNALGSGMTAYQVRVCNVDNAEGTGGSIVYDSGEIGGSATSHVPTSALPTDQQLWAFVNEKYSHWISWSQGGNGGFYCVTSVPTPPTVTSPSSTVVGCKPAVVFSGGVCHNQLEVKIATTPDGSGTPVWTSGTVDSVKNGASCSVMLTPGTQYYAFAKAGNPIGWSDWSAASPFQVTRVGEGTDIRNMDETWEVGGTSFTVYDRDAPAPDDGFAVECGGGMNWIFIKWQILPDPFNRFADTNSVYPDYQPCDWRPNEDYPGMLRDDPGYWVIPPVPDRTAPSYVYDLWDTGTLANDNSMKLHRVAGIDLDKGVTFTTYARGRCWEAGNCGSHYARQIAQQAQIYVMDDYGTGKCMASFRYGQGTAGICTDAANWIAGAYTDNQEPDRPGQGWHLVRITGRNRVVGDPTTCEWNYYLDDNPTPLVTAIGTMDQSIAPTMVCGPIVDAIAIGNGDSGLVGNWQYDWTAVNTDGDYAPAEWYCRQIEYPTVSGAVAEAKGLFCRITGEAVITDVRMLEGSQIGFWVQDVATEDYVNAFIPTTNTTLVAVGHKVTGLSGVVLWVDGMGAVLASPSFTVTTDSADAFPISMTQKSLAAGGWVTEYPAGVESTGRFVRICGKVTQKKTLNEGTLAVYLDDGCGLVDGRSADGGDAAAKGVRIIVESPASFTGAIGDFYRVDGICGYETWTEGPWIKTVRTVLAPTLALIED